MRFGICLVLMAAQVFADKDNHTDFVQVCHENGYSAESFTVVSDDGYVSQLYRIPGKTGEAQGARKPAVLMQHGIECDMNFWMPNEPAKVPPFILADLGYDVWLGNNRGNRFSKYHTTLDPAEPEYWRFSQEEMGLHDLPTFIDYVLEKTGQDQLSYIGHSQGTTQMFMGSSLNPEYFNAKVNLFVALGPVTTLQNIRVPVVPPLAREWREIEYLALKFGAYDLLNFGWLEEDAVQLLCNVEPKICDALIRYTADAEPEVDAMDRYDVFLKDFPAGNGYGNLVYYAQDVINSEPWQRYDLGAIGNMEKYGQVVPPKFPLDQISLPTALFVGIYDNLATVEDNEWLATQLNPEWLIWHDTYPLGHLSFSLAKDMSWFSTDVVDLVNQYATNSFTTEEPTQIETN